MPFVSQTAASATGDELAAMNPGVCGETATPGVYVVDMEVFLCYGYTNRKMVQQLRSGSGTYKVAAGWSPINNKAIKAQFDGDQPQPP